VTALPVIFLGIGAQAGIGMPANQDPANVPRSSGPPLPYADQGACPWEKCAYGEVWTANSITPILRDRKKKSPVAFQVNKGEQVRGVTGVVMTLKAGRAEVFKRGELGSNKVKVKPGDMIHVLHYMGAGVWAFWLKGEIVFSDELADINDYADDSQILGRIRTYPVAEWWVKIKNSRGQVGWSDRPDNFDDSH
jgi:hypothetical protein